MPTIATVIMSSISVNPECLDLGTNKNLVKELMIMVLWFIFVFAVVVDLAPAHAANLFIEGKTSCAGSCNA